jgi:hypothetical protein
MGVTTNLLWKRRIGFLLIVLEIVWSCAWFSGMIAFNLDTHEDGPFEQAHFDSVVHIVGLPLVIAAYIALAHGAKKGEMTDIRVLFFCLLAVGFVDSRGAVHAARLLPQVSWKWPLFTGIAASALALTGLEMIWFLWVTWELWSRIPQELNSLWSDSVVQQATEKARKKRDHMLAIKAKQLCFDVAVPRDVRKRTFLK